MTYLWALVAGIAAAVAGWFVTGMLGAWIAGLFGMSDFEGGRGMFAFLFVGPIGGLIAMVLAVWAARRVGKGRAAFGPTAARVGLVLAGIVAVVGAGLWLWVQSVDTYGNEAAPTLEFELRVPASIALAARDQVRVEVHTDRNVGDAWFADPWLRTDGDAQVVSGGVPLAFKTTSRLLAVSLPGQPTRLFRLPLARNPASTATPSDWVQPDFLDDPGQAQPAAAPRNDPVTLRFRVRRPGDD